MNVLAIIKDIGVILTLIISLISLIKIISNYISKINEYENTIKINTGIIQKNSNDLKIINKTMLLIMEYEINGNNIDKLKEEKDKLEDYLANK